MSDIAKLRCIACIGWLHDQVKDILPSVVEGNVDEYVWTTVTPFANPGVMSTAVSDILKHYNIPHSVVKGLILPPEEHSTANTSPREWIWVMCHDEEYGAIDMTPSPTLRGVLLFNRLFALKTSEDGVAQVRYDYHGLGVFDTDLYKSEMADNVKSLYTSTVERVKTMVDDLSDDLIIQGRLNTDPDAVPAQVKVV